jgi:hypothetical protein
MPSGGDSHREKGEETWWQRQFGPLLVSSGTTAWTRCHLERLGGNDARFCWLLCGEEGGVGEKCSAAPRVEAEEKLGEEMLGAHQLKGGGGGVRYILARM